MSVYGTFHRSHPVVLCQYNSIILLHCIRDSRRIVIDELISEIIIINGAKTHFCEVVGR
jgi:hypothetical protein